MPIWPLYSALVLLIVAAAIVGATVNRRQAAAVPVPAIGRASAAEVALAARIARDDDLTFRDWLGSGDGRRAFTYTGETAHIPVIRPVVEVPEVMVIDERTAEVLAAPGLTAHDLVGVVEQVAPGVGSVVSMGDVVEDTGMRTSAELAALHAAEFEAYDEIEANEVRLFMAGFNARLDAGLAQFDAATGRVDMWFHYLHESGHDGCPRCQEALHEVSDEHRRIVSGYPTGAYDLGELQKLLAVDA